jgi:RHS repeat-associated protein
MSRKFGNLILLLAVVLGLAGRALASSTATITVNGAEQSGDSNTITVSFNGFVETVRYGQYSTPASVASAFGAMFSRDYLQDGLCANASGSTINFKLKGSAPFGTLDVNGSTASFQLASSGFATQVSKTVDVGTVTLTVGGVVAATTNYGDGATPSSIAEGLAANITSGSPVNVTAVDDSLNLQAKQTGSNTNYSYTLQTTSWDSTDFSQPSFVPGGVSGSLSGGVSASSGQGQQTLYSYSIPSYSSGSQPTGYDANGNVVGYTDSIMGTWSMANGYDQLNRLTSASASAGTYAGLQISWGYDPFGNRTNENYGGSTNVSLPTSSTTVYTATTNNPIPNNRISSTSLGTIQYDSSGDVTQDNQNQYIYDGEGRVCAVKNLMFGTMTGYVFGADGTRVSTGTITTWGSCDPTANGYVATKDSILSPAGGQLTETGVDANGSVVWAHTNVRVGGQLLATYDPNGIHFYLNDWNGSRRVQTDYEGVVEQTCGNLPYGGGATCGPNPAEELYAGLEQDSESGLDHAMFRQYASAMGRWTTPDPYDGSYNVFDPQSLNRYAYVNSNPLGAADPSGLDDSDCFMPSYSTTPVCATSLILRAGSALVNSTDLSTFNAPLASLIDEIPYVGQILDDTPVGMLTGAGELFYGLGQSFGWWGSQSSDPSFHGNASASQSGKDVPVASNATGSSSGVDGMADNPMAQALFHSAQGQQTWNSAAWAVSPQGIATWYGASAVGAVGVLGIGGIGASEVATEFSGESLFGDHVLAQMDASHLAGRYMAEEVLTNGEYVGMGDYAGFGTRYVSYTMEGAVNGNPGYYVVGGHVLDNGLFYITHALFTAF